MIADSPEAEHARDFSWLGGRLPGCVCRFCCRNAKREEDDVIFNFSITIPWKSGGREGESGKNRADCTSSSPLPSPSVTEIEFNSWAERYNFFPLVGIQFRCHDLFFLSSSSPSPLPKVFFGLPQTIKYRKTIWASLLSSSALLFPPPCEQRKSREGPKFSAYVDP